MITAASRAAFEQYAQSQGCNDFEYDQDDAQRYCNPFTQGKYKYWVACAAHAASAQSTQVADPAIGTPEGMRNYAKGYAAGRKKERAEAARQPAPALTVKSWRERVSSQWLDKMARDGIDPGEAAMLAEIADLRAALASTQKGA